MPYTPDWVSIADALTRVVNSGVAEDQAKLDLCRAVADRRINVRVRIALADRTGRGQVFSNGNVGVPPHLAPEDLDWVHSCPLKPWAIGPMLGQHYSGWKWENRSLDLIELATDDVSEVLSAGAGAEDNASAVSAATANHETAAIKALASHLRSNPQLKRADAAAWCRESGYNLGTRAFGRVWPPAREKAGLDRLAAPGRKRKSFR